MVKGISRQVIVVHSPDPKLFEQAIFILRDGQEGITDEALLKEAKQLLRKHHSGQKARLNITGLLCAAAGATVTGLLWLLSAFL